MENSNKTENTKVAMMVTLGPATKTEESVARLKASGVDFVRVNLSHSSLEEMAYFINITKKIGVPFVIDTEGSQVRSGNVEDGAVELKDNKTLVLTSKEIVGNEESLTLRPAEVFEQLELGDVLYLDTGTLSLRIVDVSEAASGKVLAKVLSGGRLGSSKGVVIDSRTSKSLKLPALTAKDRAAIDIGLKEGCKQVAVSFVRSARDVEMVRTLTEGKMEIISKIECIDALHNFDDILSATDHILIDRGDLSKEILIENIATAQRLILHKARKAGKKAFIATNVLETMVAEPRPTRAEVSDVISCILQGAYGLTLAAETAIGKYPIECVIVLKKLITIASALKSDRELLGDKGLSHFLDDVPAASTALFLNKPNGGQLIDRCVSIGSLANSNLPKIEINERQYMDLEAIAVGIFSPLEGFMTEVETASVLETMRLPSGIIWPLPILLDLHDDQVEDITSGNKVLLTHGIRGVVGMIEVSDVFPTPKHKINSVLYGSNTLSSPGVQLTESLREVSLGGKISLFAHRNSQFTGYEFTPRQVRRMFAERNWSRVIGFHTRNIPHRGHEFVQQAAISRNLADGLFLHPVIGRKKEGDFLTQHILKAYEILISSLPKRNAILGAFSTYSRYAGPREALFTALCRKNFGCSHFIVGRDHTGGGGNWSLYASQDIFDQFPDLGIEIIKMPEVAYDALNKAYVEITENQGNDSGIERMSATKIRNFLKKGGRPPEWLLRAEITDYLTSQKNGDLFVPHRGVVLWLTGLSGSGKTTLANHLKDALLKAGKSAIIIDGDIVREKLHGHLSFSQEDIAENNRLVAHIAAEERKKFDVTIVSLISPHRKNRAVARAIADGDFLEAFVDAPLETCIERDPKGLYKKVAKGELSSFIGMTSDSPYERPQAPDIHIETSVEDIEASVTKILRALP